MLLIARFMYTGQLDIGEGSVPSLLSTAQFLDMPLLEQLLQTHVSASGQTPQAATPNVKVQRPVKAAVKTPNYSISSSPRSVRNTPKPELLPAGPGRIDLEVGDSACEFGSLPKLSELLMDSPTAMMSTPLPAMLRKTTTASTNRGVKRDLKQAEKTFDQLKKTTSASPAIRRATATSETVKPPDAKKLREEDIEGFKELLAEQRRRSELAAEQGEDTTTYDASAADVGLDDWEEDDDEEEQDSMGGGLKTESSGKTAQHKSILKSEAVMSPSAGESKRVHFMVGESDQSAAATASTSAATGEDAVAEPAAGEAGDSEETNMQQLMAAAGAAEEAVGESESTPDKDSSTITIFNENAEVLLREVVHSNTMSSQVQGRMIAEVLKRNPNLVSAGKNTKLKIVQRSPWWAKARVSFVLLKPTSGDQEQEASASAAAAAAAAAKPSILRQHNSPSVARKTGATGLGSSGAIAVNKRVSPFDNTNGPWICYECIQTTEDGHNAALRLKTYYEYRTHLIQNHGFKADSQV